MKTLVYYVIFAVFAEEMLDKERTDGHAHVAVDVRDAVLPPFRLLPATVQHGVQILLQILILLTQVVESVTHKSPKQVVCNRPNSKSTHYYTMIWSSSLNV